MKPSWDKDGQSECLLKACGLNSIISDDPKSTLSLASMELWFICCGIAVE